MKKMCLVLCALCIGLKAIVANAAAPLNVDLDKRGLLVVRGVTWPEGDWWSGVNLVSYGPGGGYRAQDQEGNFKMKDLGDGDADFNGTLWTPGATMKVHEEIRSIDGALSGKKRVSWRLAPEGRDKLNASSAYVFFPIKLSVFDGGKFLDSGGKEVLLQDAPPEKLDASKKYTFIGVNGETKLELWDMKADEVTLVCDTKKGQYEVRFAFPDVREAKESEIAFSFGAVGDAKFAAKAPPKRTVVTNGADWVEFPFVSEVKDGTILDFSKVFRNDAPAGKFGRIVADKAGHLVYEKTGKPVRLIGANLNYGANFLDKEWADNTAKDFRRMGYNAVRYHHIDVSIQKGDWNSWNSDNINPAALDKLDYLFFAMKREGMYSTTDLYQMRRVGKGEIEGIDEALDFGQLKGYLPYHPPAFECWKKFARSLLNHVNPYTGLAWKDDPSLVFLCPVNEDSICSISPNDEKSKVWPFFSKMYDEWRKEREDTPQLRVEFMNRAKAKFDRDCAKFLREEVGYKGLLTSENWWDLKSQAFLRDRLDIVDNHGYADHPQGWPNQRWNQSSNTKQDNMAYLEPVMKAPSRIPDKPMAITEWNFCAPNRFRAESGVTMGAYASLQDFSALYRFAWSHEPGRITNPSPVKHFDVVNDPVNQLAERIAVLMFRRGDVARGKESLCYAVDLEDATKDGKGDMWAKGLFPANFVTQGFLHRIGSQPVWKGHPLRGRFTKVTGANAPEASLLNGNTFAPLSDFPNYATSNEELTSDTLEISISRAGRLTVASPRTEAVVAYPKGDKGSAGFTAGGLKVAPVEKFQVVSASSMDSKPLRDSNRILLFHLTDTLNSEMLFDGEGRHEVRETGELPYLAATGKAEVTFDSKVKGLKLYAVRYDGTRIREVPATYSNGAYSFTLSIDHSAEPAMVYELTDERQGPKAKGQGNRKSEKRP